MTRITDIQFPAREIAEHTESVRKMRRDRRSNRRLPRTGSHVDITSDAKPRPPANDHYGFLAHAFEVTSDPIFRDAMAALAAYGLAGAQAGRRLQALETEMSDRENKLAEQVDSEVASGRSKEHGYRTVALRAQPEFVSQNPEGDGLDAAIKRVKRAHRKTREAPGATGRKIVVVSRSALLAALGGPIALHKLGAAQVPDDLDWRHAIDEGVVLKLWNA